MSFIGIFKLLEETSIQRNEKLNSIVDKIKTYIDELVIDMATMFSFIKNQSGTVAIANKIFETRLYNFYLSMDKMQNLEINKASLQDKS